MSDLFDLEAEMHEAEPDPAWAAKVERARARVAAHTRERLLAPCDGSCLNPEAQRIARRPL